MTVQVLAKSLLQKGVMKERATEKENKKYKMTSLDPSLSEGMTAAGLFKAILMKASGKYIRRIPKAGGGYRYIYKEPGKGQAEKKPEEKEGFTERKEGNMIIREYKDIPEAIRYQIPGKQPKQVEIKSPAHWRKVNQMIETQDAETLAITEANFKETREAPNLKGSLSKALLRKSYQGVVTGEYYGTEGEREAKKKNPGTSAILGKDMDSSLAGNGNDMAMLATMLNGGQPWRSGILY